MAPGFRELTCVKATAGKREILAKSHLLTQRCKTAVQQDSKGPFSWLHVSSPASPVLFWGLKEENCENGKGSSRSPSLQWTTEDFSGQRQDSPEDHLSVAQCMGLRLLFSESGVLCCLMGCSSCIS